MKKMIDIISEHSFFKDLSPDNLTFIAGCGKNILFKEGEMIANPGDIANSFYLIREGKVSISLENVHGKQFIFQTLGKNDILGLAWLIPPYRWTVSASSVETTHAIALDGECLRKKCEEDPNLGYKLMKHLTQILVTREESAMLHLLDVYGKT